MSPYCWWIFLMLVWLLMPLQTVAETLPPPNLTVQDAVRFGLNNSPDTKAAAQRIVAAAADMDRARAAFYPQLDLSAGYDRTNNPMYSFGNILNQGLFTDEIDFNNPGVTDNLQLKALLKYRIYNGGRDQAGLEGARSMERASEMQKITVHDQLGYEIVKAFYTVYQAEETLQARDSAVDAIGASVAVAQARFEEGDLLKEDVLNLEVLLSRAKENRIQTKHGLNLSRRGLLNLLGCNEGSINLDIAGSTLQKIPVDPDYLNRSELAAINALLEAADAEVRKANGGRYPTADAYGSYQVDNGYELDDGSGNSWLAGVRLNYTLFDGQQTAAEVARARARLTELKEEKRKMELAFAYEIEQAGSNLQQAEERLQVTGKMVELATESARLSRVRFKEGVILSSDLIDTENRLTEAQVRYLVARTSRAIAIAELRRAAGLKQFPH